MDANAVREMENITLGQIAVALAFLVGLATAAAYLHKLVKGWISKSLKEEFDGLNNKFDGFKKDITESVDGLKKQLHEVDIESCKNYLVAFLADVDQGQPIDEIERERFWEEYQHYEKQGGNSYIHRKVEQLKSDNKL